MNPRETVGIGPLFGTLSPTELGDMTPYFLKTFIFYSDPETLVKELQIRFNAIRLQLEGKKMFFENFDARCANFSEDLARNLQALQAEGHADLAQEVASMLQSVRSIMAQRSVAAKPPLPAVVPRKRRSPAKRADANGATA